MKAAYIVNQYPKVSHSFIRREILALEAQGVTVQRYAIRVNDAELVDEQDRSERAKCRYVVGESPTRIAGIILAGFMLYPSRMARAAMLATKIGWRSDRGLLRHIAYWVEACIVARWCSNDGVSHLHAHFGTNSAAIAMLTSVLTRLPFSFTVHGPEEFDKADMLSLGEKARQAAFVVAVCSFGRSQLQRWTDRRDWAKIHVIRCGIEPNFIPGTPRRPPSPIRLACIARLCEQKGLFVLLEAAALLKEGQIPFQVVVVGDGPLRPELERMIRDRGLEAHVSITGWVDSARVRKELELSRALVLPSFAEGLPVVIMEAMALERPVISTFVAGIPELVTDKETGWLVPAGDAIALADAMRTALQTPPDDIAKMGRRARAAVGERHDIAKEAGRLRHAMLAAAPEARH